MASSSSSSYHQYEIRSRLPSPSRCALLVIDVQNHFASISTPILPSLNTTIHLFRSTNSPILFTRHSHKTPSDHAMLGEWWGPSNLISDSTPDSSLLPGLDRQDSDPIVEKTTYSAFYKTGLEEVLRETGVEEVVVVGVMTNLCCETTAREAFVRGFRVFFLTDATATANEDLQQATLKNLAYGFAYLVDCRRLEDAFKRNKNNV